MRITTKQLVELILGQELSTKEIVELAQETYPGNGMTRTSLMPRLKSMVRSPNVVIVVKGQGHGTRYKLISATARYMELAEINFHSNSETGTPDKTLWHFHPVELRFCHVHKMFDQALASVSGRASA
jgi:hypothetical protein